MTRAHCPVPARVLKVLNFQRQALSPDLRLPWAGPRPSTLMVLNESRTSLHPDLLPALGKSDLFDISGDMTCRPGIRMSGFRLLLDTGLRRNDGKRMSQGFLWSADIASSGKQPGLGRFPWTVYLTGKPTPELSGEDVPNKERRPEGRRCRLIWPYLVVGTTFIHLAVRHGPTRVSLKPERTATLDWQCTGPSLLNGQSDRLQIIQQLFEYSPWFGRR